MSELSLHSQETGGGFSTGHASCLYLFELIFWNHSSAIADHIKTTGHNIKWDNFDILAYGKTDYHCKIKKT